MRVRATGLVCCALLACVGLGGPETPPVAIWVAPEPPEDAASLRIEPASSVAPWLGGVVRLRLRGSAAADAHCLWGEDGHGAGRLEVHSPALPGVVDVRCRSGVHTAAAQVTFSDAATRPVDDPYEGAVALFKLTKRPRAGLAPSGQQALGLASLDVLLERLDAWALPAFPFDRSGTRDAAGLDSWIAVVIPEWVNFYQAVSLLRADPNVYPESYLPLPDLPSASDVTPLGVTGERDRGMARIPPPSARGAVDGQGIGIAIVGAGLDLDDPVLAERIRTKPLESDAGDEDGNGLPGDRAGADFGRLVIDRAAEAPRLALALGARTGADTHGTSIARVALATAPGAWVLPVPAHDSVWSRALGVAYAAAEGARIVVCDWPEPEPHWILYDALLYAQDNCALAVCTERSIPSDWRGEESGSALDVWSGELRPEFHRLPLLGLSVDPFPGELAGDAAVVMARRPDLGPAEVSQALLASDPVVAAELEPRGFCSRAGARAREAGGKRPWWRRAKVKVVHERKTTGPQPPAAPEP